MSHQRIAVPAYFPPAPEHGMWAGLVAAAPRLDSVVVNVDSGPGTRPVPGLLRVLTPLAAAGVRLLGYVDTDYGRRPTGQVLADLARYRAWYPVGGFFLDQVASQSASLDWYRPVVAAARGPGPDTVVLNHGVYPDPRYVDLADALVTFEGPWPAYRRQHVPSWVRERPPERFWHLIYATPEYLLTTALQLSAGRHVGTVYITDLAGPNPWAALPGYFGVEARCWADRPRVAASRH